MRPFFAALTGVAAVLLASSGYAVAQECTGLPDTRTIESLIASVFTASDNPTPPTIGIMQVNYVCMTSGMFRGTYRGISLLAKYSCSGSALCPSDVVEKSQFDFSCPADTWVGQVLGSAEFVFTPNPLANFTTAARTDCSFCVNPRQIEASAGTVVADEVSHCVACNPACNQGAMKCFGLDENSCCSYYDSSENDKCVDECPEDRRSPDFTCEAFVRFAQGQYTFSEGDGMGSVVVEGSEGVTVRVFGGPPPQTNALTPSGTSVDETITSFPAIVTFNIMDDDAAIEDDEIYPLILMVEDNTTNVQRRFTDITIINDDLISLGFERINYRRIEGVRSNVSVPVSGNALQRFGFIYIQALSGQEELHGEPGNYSTGIGATLFPVVINPDDEIALQDDRIFEIALAAIAEFTDDLQFGVPIRNRPTFATSNLTIIDDDVVSVTFDQPSYTVLESGSVNITLMLDRGIASDFGVLVRPGPSMPSVLSPSVPTRDYMVSFQVTEELQSQSFVLTPVDDTVPSEPPEQFQLMFSFVSDQRVVIEDTADVIIIDDDELAGEVGFEAMSYTFFENEGQVSVTVTGPENFPSTLSVNIVGGPLTQDNVVTSGAAVNQTLSVFPAQVVFTLTDDRVAIEDVERYTLTLIASDDSINISPNTAEIVVLDDDRMIVGFPYESKTFGASEMGSATVVVNGEAIQDFRVTYVEGLQGETTLLEFEAGVYVAGSERQIPLTFPADLQEDITFQIFLSRNSPGVDIGGIIGTENPQEVFPTANITVVVDNIVVGFNQPEYTFSEGFPDPSVFIRRSAALDDFSVDITADTMVADFVFQSAFADQLQGTVEFGALEVEYPLDIRNDDVAIENPETFMLILGNASDNRVVFGGQVEGSDVYPTARVTIVDDDLAQVTLATINLVFAENNGPAIVVRLLNTIVSGRSVNVNLTEEGRGNMEFVVQSLTIPDNILTFGDMRTQIVRPDYNDDLVGLEDLETLMLALRAVSDPTQIVFVDRNTSVSVLDNEVVNIGIVGDSTRVCEGDPVDVCVSKDIESVREVDVILTPQPGTAGTGDYSPTTPQPITLTISAGQQCISFSAIRDSEAEDDEVFSISLSPSDMLMSAMGAINFQNVGIDVTINDASDPACAEQPEVEDTVIGDPLFTVPITSEPTQPSQHLCYEIRGAVDQFFNFISDNCVSVNAHYTERNLRTDPKPLHVVDEIGIRAVNNDSECVNIRVDRNGCTTYVDNSIISESYSRNGVRVVVSGRRVEVSVLNCDETDLMMQIICESMNGQEMLRFEVERGVNLRDTSHGLLGQFWNIPVSVESFRGALRDGEPSSNVYIITLRPPGRDERRFPAWLEQKTWDNRRTCFYAGNQNGGTVYELADAHDSLIEGVYKDYITDGLFSTEFKYDQFEEDLCITMG